MFMEKQLRQEHRDFPSYKAAYERAIAEGVAKGTIKELQATFGGPPVPPEHYAAIAAKIDALPRPTAQIKQFPPIALTPDQDQQLVKNQYEPIVVDGKAAVAEGWQLNPIDNNRIKKMRELYPDAKNTGLRTGILSAIDIDIRDAAHAEQVASLADKLLGETPLRRVGSKGVMLCYWNKTPIRKVTIATEPKAKDEFADKVEVLGTGLQFVAFGIHPETKQPFRWIGKTDFDEEATPLIVPLDSLPVVMPEKIFEFADKCATLLGALGYESPRVRKPYEGERKTRDTDIDEDAPANVSRAREHLVNCVERGEVAVLGQFGNDAIYNKACLLRDRFYLSQEAIEELMLTHWYPHCIPNTLEDDARTIISHAIEYMQNEPGASAVPPASEAFKDALAKETAEPSASFTAPDESGTRYFEGLGIRRMSDVRSEKREWLWQHRIASGALSMIAGLPGEAKTTIAFEVTARITRGEVLPGNDAPTEQGSVLIMSAEDHEKQTIKPRLAAAGADMTKVFSIDATVDDKDDINNRLLSLKADLKKLGRLVEKLREENNNIRLVIIDPISAYVGEGDSHKNSQVRGMLTPLSKLAEKHKFAVLLVSHYKKNAEGTTALYRVTDSIAFVAACRTVLLTGREMDDEGNPTGRKLLLNGKPNIIPEDTPGLAYRTDTVAVTLEDGNTDDVPRIKWDGFVDTTPDEAMAAVLGTSGADKITRAAEWLETLLTDHPMPEKEVHKRAYNQKFSRATLKRAKKRAGVISTQQGFGRAKVSWWAIPEGEPEASPPPEPELSGDDDLPPDTYRTLQ